MNIQEEYSIYPDQVLGNKSHYCSFPCLCFEKINLSQGLCLTKSPILSHQFSCISFGSSEYGIVHGITLPTCIQFNNLTIKQLTHRFWKVTKMETVSSWMHGLTVVCIIYDSMTLATGKLMLVQPLGCHCVFFSQYCWSQRSYFRKFLLMLPHQWEH